MLRQGADESIPNGSDPETLKPVQLRGDGVAELSSAIVMEAACGDGYCALLTEREVTLRCRDHGPAKHKHEAVVPLSSRFLRSCSGCDIDESRSPSPDAADVAGPQRRVEARDSRSLGAVPRGARRPWRE